MRLPILAERLASAPALASKRCNPAVTAVCAAAIDALHLPVYSSSMAVKSVRLGQVWRHDVDSSTYLVTKLYNEVFTQYAILRRADANAANEDTIRIKVVKTGDGVSLPGYTFTQEAEEF